MPVNPLDAVLAVAMRLPLHIPDVASTAWAGHSAFAHDLVRFTRPRLLVELGTHGGFSFFSFCHAAKEHCTGTACHAVDTWEGDEQAGYYGNRMFSFVEGYGREHFTGIAMLERMTFDAAAERFADGSIDVLHIDGLHTYEAVKHDWETWSPKVRPGGVVLFHDIVVRKRGFGVWQLWEELSAKHPSFAFDHSAGLGVLCMGAVPEGDDFLRLLFNGSEKDRAALRAHYGVSPLFTTQVYWSGDGAFSEERSQSFVCAGGSETVQRFTFPAARGPLHLRFDPANACGLMEIAAFTVRHSASGEPLLSLHGRDDWRRLRRIPSLLQLPAERTLRLYSLNADPNFLLPPMEVTADGGSIECEVRMTIHPGGGEPPVTQRGLGAAPEGRVGMSVGEAKKLFSIAGAGGPGGAASVLEWLGGIARQLRFSRRRRRITEEFSHFIDTLFKGSTVPHKGYIRGWVFSRTGEPCVAVRMCADGRIMEGRYFQQREDVGKENPEAGDYCGFSIPYQFPGAGKFRIALEVLTRGGRWVRIARCWVNAEVDPKFEDVEYAEWLGKNAAAHRADTAPADGPLISVLLPVYNPPEALLRRAIGSVLAQTYGRWELCIANDASSLPHVRKVLDESVARDSRIRIVHRENNGHICAASNSALALATGEFTALLDHDDELAPHALAELARAILAHPQAGLIYSDEDKLDERGCRYDPHFKPDWQPDLLLGQNYLSHLSAYRTALMREAGGFRAGYEGSQDWDLALRITERLPAAAIVHIPQVLYHWRAAAGSTALGVGEKDYTVDAAESALKEHLARTGQRAELVRVPGGHWRVRHALPSPPPKVSIIIPTRDCAELLRTCIESLLAKTAYADFEILVVDNGSESPSALAYFAELRGRGVKVIRDDSPFNFSALNNRAVAHATGTVLAFLNNDIEVISTDWLAEMVGHAVRPGVGAVGAMLYYPDDTIQHAGVVLGIAGPRLHGGVAGHAMKGAARGTDGNMNRLRLVRNWSAVTGACLVVQRAVFERLGGFNETDLAVAFNDVDFCLRARAVGLRNVWTPFAELYHHESVSRGYEDTREKLDRFEQEYAYMRARWGSLLDDDPAYNPNLTLIHEDCRLAWPPRAIAPARGERAWPAA